MGRTKDAVDTETEEESCEDCGKEVEDWELREFSRGGHCCCEMDICLRPTT